MDPNYVSANQPRVYLIELSVGGRMILGKRIARNVKAIRLGQGLSQQDLASKTGLTVRYISRLENTAPNLTLEVIEKLAHGLDCSATILIGEQDDTRSLPGMKETLDKAIHLLQALRSRL